MVFFVRITANQSHLGPSVKVQNLIQKFKERYIQLIFNDLGYMSWILSGQ